MKAAKVAGIYTEYMVATILQANCGDADARYHSIKKQQEVGEILHSELQETAETLLKELQEAQAVIRDSLLNIEHHPSGVDLIDLTDEQQAQVEGQVTELERFQGDVPACVCVFVYLLCVIVSDTAMFIIFLCLFTGTEGDRGTCSAGCRRGR